MTVKPITLNSGQLRQLQAAETLQLMACSTANASVNCPHGTAPSAPVNGDLWSTSSAFFARVNGTTVQLADVAYVDAKVAGLSWKHQVRAATTGPGTLATSFENGDTIDGVTLATGDRILVKDQASGAQNGIYIVAASGAPTRATDADSGTELVNATCYVSEGTVNADTQWTCSTNAPITLNTTALVFAQFSSGGYTDEQAQDAVGTILVDSAEIDFTYNDAAPSIAASLINNSVVAARLAATATARIFGRKSASAGAGEELTFSEVLDFVGSAARGDILYRGATLWTRLAAGTSGYVLTTAGAGADPSWTAPGTITVLPDAVSDAQWFGDGSDGDLTAAAGTTTLTRDTYYNNVTLSGTAKIITANFRLYIKGTLDITAAGAAAISINGTNGTTTTSAAGGARGTALTAGTLDNPPVATPGVTGTTGAGTSASLADSGSSAKIGGECGTSGAGGAVGATAGGGARTASTLQRPLDSVRRLSIELAAWTSAGVFTKFTAGGPASGGSSGAGDGVGTGGGGGGGASAGGMLWVAARTIARGASTAVGCFAAKGGNGGGGANGGTGGTNRGGGGGAAGAGGGVIRLHFRTLTGSTATNALDASGGDGGAGGNGVGTGIGGDSGGGGGGGPIDLFNFGAGTWTSLAVSAAVAGNAHSSGTGGAAKSATAQQLSL